MTILDALVQRNIVSPKDVPAIQKEMDDTGVTLEAILQGRGISEQDLLKVKGEILEVPTRTLDASGVPFSVLEFIPEDSAIHYKFAPLAVNDGVLEVGLVDPDNIEARDALNFISSKINMPYKVFLISTEDFEKILGIYKGLSAEVTKALDDLDTELKADIAAVAGKNQKDESNVRTPVSVEQDDEDDPKSKLDTKIVEDAPVTKIVATILRYATEGNASDIHIEHMRDNVRVRFRVDGILNTSLMLPIKVHSALIARIKILSNMRLDEKRKPQDGRFSAKIEGKKIDFRVSTFPTYYGEKIVMRILDQEKGVKKFEDMGLTPRNLELIKKAILKPYGLILISGPTGSGKSTTLYSMLNLIDREEKNVLSLEDPIEYNIEGISQSQVRPEIGYTFATGLRTTLRQDPNVIMVGEIRDKETAQLAVQAALTGHLVLSTIHTNNAVGVIPRLIDMGVDPYLIAPTLVVAMAQRLAATLCSGSGRDVPIEGSLQLMIDKQFEDLPPEFRQEIMIPQTVKEIEITAECPSGTRGRAAVFEMFEMDKEIEKTILTNPTALELSKVVRRKGMLSMKEDALLRAFRGELPLEEVNKL
ncbi:MAG: GspE/PulE family protein [bacterium]|nr:GspE/PulE family protein [bacterium]